MGGPRNGKIGRASKEAREELNRRIDAGDSGRETLEWFNGLPEVRKMLAEEFGGAAVNEPNLSEWRKGGYRDWVAHQNALNAMWGMEEEALTMTETKKTTGGLSDAVCWWLSGRYAIAARAAQNENGEIDLKMLRTLCRDMTALRRGDLASIRERRKILEYEQRDEEIREKSEQEMWDWAMQDKIRDKLMVGYLTPEQRAERDRAKIDAARMRLFGVLAEPTESFEDGAEPESNGAGEA